MSLSQLPEDILRFEIPKYLDVLSNASFCFTLRLDSSKMSCSKHQINKDQVFCDVNELYHYTSRFISMFHQYITASSAGFLARHAAYSGNLDLLKWFHFAPMFVDVLAESMMIDQIRLVYSLPVYLHVVRKGHIEVLKWMHGNGFKIMTYSTWNEARLGKRRGIINWLKRSKCPTTPIGQDFIYPHRDTFCFDRYSMGTGKTYSALICLEGRPPNQTRSSPSPPLRPPISADILRKILNPHQSNRDLRGCRDVPKKFKERSTQAKPIKKY